MRRLGCSFVVLVALAGLLLPAAPAQAQAPFALGLTYIVPHPDDGNATVFQAFTSPTAALRGTIGLPTPRGADDIVVRNDTAVLLDWVPRADGGIDVAVPRGSLGVQVTSRGVPAEQGVRFGDDAAAERTILWVALPQGWNVTKPTVRLLDTADAGLFPGIWPLPADRRLAVADLDHVEEVRFVRIAAATDAPDRTPLWIGGGALLLLATLLATYLVHRSVARPTTSRMSILEHLTELRRRAMWTVGTLIGGALFFFAFGFHLVEVAGVLVPLPLPSVYDNVAAQVFTWIAEHAVPDGVQVVVVNPWDAVVTQMGLAIGLSVAVAFPVLFYHVYAFLAPGLYPKERRAVVIAVPGVVILFLVGAAFGLLLMLPLTVTILYTFAGTLDAAPLLNVADLVSVASLMALVFGLSFQLPLIMALTARLGLVSARAYRQKWRHAVLGIAIVAAVITDPTVVSQILVALVLLGLYGFGLVLAALVERRAREASTEAPAASG